MNTTFDAGIGQAAEHPAIDTTLRIQAQDLMRSHAPGESGSCQHPSCKGVAYPCVARRVAGELSDASSGPWPRQWTARLDAQSCGIPVVAVRS
ncbi:hypothetical protein ACQP2P_16370 [Dactylosporangium sp. CA-139114]|uniref:hypothetical protein n=1 Tax=Dactylosporangium sp. CA-139114 TaxID=3239931 RepID=UPI003D988FD8